MNRVSSKLVHPTAWSTLAENAGRSSYPEAKIYFSSQESHTSAKSTWKSEIMTGRVVCCHSHKVYLRSTLRRIGLALAKSQLDVAMRSITESRCSGERWL